MAASREALLGVNNGLRAFQDGMKELTQAIKSIAVISKKFTTDTARAHYNTLGQHTFPIEQEIVGTEPPQIDKLNILGQSVLLVPIILPSIVLSLTLFPLIGNNIQSIPHGVKDMANLALEDLPPEQKFSTYDHRNWWRQAYGIPAYLASGIIIGIPATVAIALGRIVYHSCVSAPYTCVPLLNLALPGSHTIDALEPDERSLTKQRLGAPGLLLGAVFGLVGMAGIALIRALVNSFKSLYRFIAHGINLALTGDAMSGLPLSVDARSQSSFYFGIPGMILGSILGAVTGFIVTTAITTARTTAESWNGVLANDDMILLSEDTRHPLSILIGFLPGNILGTVSGLIGVVAIGIGRFIINTCKSFKVFLLDGLNLGLPSASQIANEDNRQALSSQWFGVVGAVTGALFGLTLGTIASMSITSFITFCKLTNVALHADNQINISAEETRSWLGMVIGSPGYLIGSITGLMGLLAVGSGRGVVNSGISWLSAFRNALNIGLTTELKLEVPADERDVNSQRFGFIGKCLGGMFGIVTAFFASTSITSIGVWIRITNLALDDEHKFQVGNDTRSPAGQYLGGLGFILGGIFGAMCAAVVSITSIIRNGRVSMLRGLYTGLNLALATDKQYEISPDTRPSFRILFGTPAYYSGLLMGGIASFFMSTAITSARTFKAVTNLILDPQDEFAPNDDDKRCNTGKILGIAGLLFGGTAGLFGAVGIACGRVITNTFKSFILFFKVGLNLGLPSHTLFNTEDNRSSVSHTFGAAGLVTGFISGFTTAIFASSAITTERTFMHVTNLTLNPDDEMTVQEDKRSTIGKILGVLGFIPGTIAGIFGALAVGIIRIVFNTFFTSCRFAAIVSNFGLPPEQRFEITDDNRYLNAKIMGSLGIPIGSIIGFVGAVFVSSLQTIWQTVARLFLLPWQLEEDHVSADDRFIAGKIFGIPGYIIGLPLGLVGMLFSAACRVGLTGYVASVTVACDIVNKALPDDIRIEVIPYPFTLGDKIFAVPGFIFGVFVGLKIASYIYAFRFISQTFKSWAALSGSFLNCGLGFRLFDGLSADRRPLFKKMIGSLGYGIALITTLPIAAFIFVARQIPTAVSVALGIMVSPAIVLYRGIANAWSHYSGYNKFEEPAQEGELIIENQFAMLQAFRNIYSSLNAWGGFEPGAAVAQNADGQKNRWTFFRKAVTFNTNSSTERTLDKLLAAYKVFAAQDKSEGGYGQGFPASEAFDKVIDDVKEYYSNGCFDSAREIRQLHIDINNIAKFVKSYLQDRIVNPENNAPYIIADDVAPPPPIPFAILFFGEQIQLVPADQPVIDEEAQPGMPANDPVLENNEPEGAERDERSLRLG
jgi:hypothetical protein